MRTKRIELYISPKDRIHYPLPPPMITTTAEHAVFVLLVTYREGIVSSVLLHCILSLIYTKWGNVKQLGFTEEMHVKGVGNIQNLTENTLSRETAFSSQVRVLGKIPLGKTIH